jgi:multidrug efflux pump subunit AcrA (membrane-fusion protein)
VDAESFPNRILIPREAVVERGTPRREVVFMARDVGGQGDGMAEWRYVTTGRRNETQVEIIAGETTSMLEPGEIVLVDGHHYLAHDTPIRLVDNVYLAGGRPGGEGP